MSIVWNDRKRVTNKYFTMAAVKEFNINAPDYKSTFTIAEEDCDGLYSLPKLFYKHYKDPTELSFVNEVFDGDVEHWEAFKKSRMISEVYLKMRKKADMMLQSEAMNKIVNIAFKQNNLQALKYLVDRKPVAPENKRGRPKKGEKIVEISSKDLLKDLERVNG